MPASSQRLTFPGSQGAELAARLDLPAGEPRACALFAHCFTCSKDIFAAARIASELTDRGFAVFRFDFTGLGASEGEFANTNFSSNMADLVHAADSMREMHEAPTVLIGHSLGGAAVLGIAGEIPEVKAVATIGAPSDAEHVIKNFGAHLDKIEQEGVAEVELAGRHFTIKKQFLDDVKGQTLTDRIANMRKALLLFHSPVDNVVGIENAGSIFAAAKHPKSFISLDNADHLLSRREDAAYVAEVLSAWASRYVGRPEDGYELDYPGKKGVVSVGETGRGKFQQEIVSQRHRLLADEPSSHGGLDTGPSPYDLLNMALGACTSMTLRMYADRKKLALKHVRVDVRHDKIHAEDCAACSDEQKENARGGRIDRFERELFIDGDLSAEQRERLKEIADRCPVHRTLEAASVIETKLANGEKA
jgi:putative redox protein